MEIAATISPITPELKGITIARVNGAFGTKEQIRQLLLPYQQKGITTFIDLPRQRKKMRTNQYTDRELLELAQASKFSYVAVSYVDSPDDLIYNYPTLAKIETATGLANIDQIAAKADMIIVDRRDLATAIGIAQVPMAVKKIIEATHRHGKKIILASEFLINMVNGGEPSLAEVHNVLEAGANGADYLLLAEETALGKDPQAIIDLIGSVMKSKEELIINQPSHVA